VVTLLETVLGDFSRLEAETKAQELAADKEKGGTFFFGIPRQKPWKNMENHGKTWILEGFDGILMGFDGDLSMKDLDFIMR
jgi:hypothetical protein